MSREISVVSGGLAEAEVVALFSEFQPRVEERVFYPYFWFHFRYRTRSVLGESGLRIACLIDSRTRVGATTEAFEIERAAAADSEVLAPKVDADEALTIATRYGSYVLRHRKKALARLERDLVEQRVVHKPFWIVGLRQRSGGECRVLVDGVTGGFHPLPD